MNKLITCFAAALALFASSCKNNDDDGVDISPKGASPVWGPDIHKEMLAVIEQYDSFGVPPLETLSPQVARMQRTVFDAEKVLAARYGLGPAAPSADTFGREVSVPGGSIHLRFYKPAGNGSAMPAIMYYHGGGWVIATVNTYDASARSLAEQTGAMVVSVEYRKGPENKFPTAHNDAFAAYQWVLSNGAALGINTAKIAVAGESAGGNLACNVSIMARAAGVTMPLHQLLIYPVAQSDMTTASYNTYAAAKPLNKPLVQYFVSNYLNSMSEAMDPRISLVNATLSNLPPTTIINAQIDPLEDDGELLQAALQKAGVSVTRRLFSGVTHEFYGMNIVLPEAREAQAFASQVLRDALR